MKAYKGYLIALKRNISTVILYCTIFLGVAVSMVNLSNRGENPGDYSQERLAIGIVDRDNSLWSQVLEKYLEQTSAARTEISRITTAISGMSFKRIS